MNRIIVTKDPDGFLITLPTGVVHQADDSAEAWRVIARWERLHGAVEVKGLRRPSGPAPSPRWQV